MGGIKQKYNMKAVFDNLNRKQHGSDNNAEHGVVMNVVGKAVRNASLKSIDKSATHQANKRSGRGS
jgi:uncharacterized protein involved in propanediol utilization